MPPMKSSRKDGKGHWQRDRRRNAWVNPPRGWPDIGSWLQALREWCAAGRGSRGHTGRQAALADALGVHRKTLQTWLSGNKWPSQARVDEIAKWWRSNTADGTRRR